MNPDFAPLGDPDAVETCVPTVGVASAPSKVRVTSAPLSMIATLIAFDEVPGLLAAHLNVFAVAVA